jgi:K+-transporting ATPase A subunit
MHSSRAIADQRQAIRHVSRQHYCLVGGLTFLPALSLGPIAEQAITQVRRL